MLAALIDSVRSKKKGGSKRHGREPFKAQIFKISPRPIKYKLTVLKFAVHL